MSPLDQFSRCLAFTIGPGPTSGGQEGPFSNDPNDPGAATNFGVSIAQWADYTRTKPTVDDMRALTRAQVVPFYRTRYWNGMWCWDLPIGVDLMVFDFGVNAGQPTSAIELQNLVGVKVDEHIGPITALAARGVETTILLPKLLEAHLVHYKSLDDWQYFGVDWERRARECFAAAQAMLTQPAGSPA